MFSTRSLAEYSAMNILVNAIWLAPERLRRTSEGSIPEERLKEKQKVRAKCRGGGEGQQEAPGIFRAVKLFSVILK